MSTNKFSVDIEEDNWVVVRGLSPLSKDHHTHGFSPTTEGGSDTVERMLGRLERHYDELNARRVQVHVAIDALRRHQSVPA
jgi:hypothetical protein